MQLCKPGPLKETNNIISWNWKIIFYKYKSHVMATWGGVVAQLHLFLTSGLPGGEWEVTCLGCYTPILIENGAGWAP
jgi:hypothetical protein